MTAEPLTCPYCNAPVPSAAGAAVGRRLSCPRCGDSFTVKGSQASEAVRPPAPDGVQETAGAALAPPTAPPPPPSVALPTARSNRRVALAVFGGMLLMAGAGLAFALWTQQTRREHDHHMPQEFRHKRNTAIVFAPPPDPPPAEPARTPLECSTPPLQLAALGYLPRDVNVLAGVHVADLLREPGGKDWFDRPLTVGGVQVPPARLAAWTGVGLDDLDHAVFGVAIPADLGRGAALPRAYLIVHTRTPYRLSDVLERLGGRADLFKEVKSPERTLYAVRLPAPVGKAWLWSADERTLAFGLFGDDELARVPVRPAPGGEQLAAEVRTALRDHVGGPAPLWAVVHLERPLPLGDKDHPLPEAVAENVGGLKGLSGWLKQLKEIKTAALWLEGEKVSAGPAPGLVLGGAGWGGAYAARGGRLPLGADLHCRSVEAAQAMQKALDGTLPGLAANRDDTWVSLRWTTDRDALRKALEK